jgi:ADP-ribose pyrophosphatase YjhB (NUDIX family)
MPQMVRKIGAVNVMMRDGRVLLGFQKKKQGWECPGGKVEEDETIDMACPRETYEETGRKCTVPRLQGFVDTGDEHLVAIYSTAPLMLLTESLDDEQPNPEAHKFQCWKWFRLDDLPEDITWLSAQAIRIATGKQITKHLPCPFKKKQKVPA